MNGMLLVLILAACSPPSEREAPGVRQANPLVGPGSATHPAVSPDGGTVAFMSNLVGVESGKPVNFEIYLATPDAAAPIRLTHNDAFDADIAWAPDGRRLAITSFRDGNDEIYLMNRDGTELQNVTAHASSDFQPHFSPDGAFMLFASKRGGTAGLFRMDLRSGRVDELLDSEYAETSPQWSPDGSRIAFVSDEMGSDDIYVMNTDGSGKRRLASSPASDWSPRWSPDGLTVLYISGDFATDQFDLYRVDASGSGAPELIIHGVDSGNPAWAPSGDRIFFGRYLGGESRLYSANPDGSQITPFGHSAKPPPTDP